MQNCPGCQMLMDDDAAQCSACRSEPSEPSVASSGGTVLGGRTAVLERPTSVPMPATVTYRTPRGRRGGRGVLILLLLALGGGGVLLAMALRGEGPLAETVVEAGLVAAPVVSVPGAWSSASSEAGGFRAAMPSGAQRIEAPIDPANPAAGTVHGYETRLGEGGSTRVVGMDLAPRPDLVRAAAADAAAFSALIDSTVRSIGGGTAVETVRRDVRVGNGRAVDVVVVDEAEGVTTRARYHLVGSRLLGVVTTGLDEGADRLDEVHSKVLESFRPTV